MNATWLTKPQVSFNNPKSETSLIYTIQPKKSIFCDCVQDEKNINEEFITIMPERNSTYKKKLKQIENNRSNI